MLDKKPLNLCTPITKRKIAHKTRKFKEQCKDTSQKCNLCTTSQRIGNNLPLTCEFGGLQDWLIEISLWEVVVRQIARHTVKEARFDAANCSRLMQYIQGSLTPEIQA